MRLLLVEDSPRLLHSVSVALRRSGYAVDTAVDGEQGLWLAESNIYDVIILDIMLPKLDGLSVLRRLRAGGKLTHLLLLTARDTVPDRVAGLHAGADDYLVKPFSLDELLARIHALCRRSYGAKQSVLMIADLSIDNTAKKASRSGRDLELTAREFALLDYLAHRCGEVVTRSEIEAHIYDERVDPMSNVVDSAICILRKKLGAAFIQTRRGQGYVFDDPARAGPAA